MTTVTTATVTTATSATAARPGLDRVRWGAIGAGDVVERKSGPGFQQASRSELVAVMRRDGAAAADFARRHGVPRWYDDSEALIDDPDVDAVYVATPPDSHRDYVERVAAAGKPVYVEKPMARTAAECESMITACERAGVGLFVAYYRRAMPRFVRARALLESGRIGTVRSVSVRNQRPAPDPSAAIVWRIQPQVSGGGFFVDLASHTFDLLDWLFGPVTRVEGAASHPAGGRDVAETLVTASFSHECGVEGVGLWDFDAAEARDEIEIIGTAGTLQLSSFGTEPIQLRVGGEVEMVEAPYPDVVQLPLIQTIVDALTVGAPTPSTGTTAVRTARVVDTLLAGYRSRHGVTFD